MTTTALRTRRRARVAFALLLPLLAEATPAMAAERRETIRFAPGATSATLKGTIRGEDGVRYSVGAAAGQVMSVLFSPSNRSCTINVWAPGTDTAVFIGSVGGNEYSANLTVAGDYAVQVYLMRSAARRNATCRYSLTIEITGAPGGTSAGVSDSILQDRCRSEAAGMYGVTPKQVAAGAVRAGRGGGYEIDATADKGSEGVKALRCVFTPARGFDRIMAMTPDGKL